MSCPNSSDMGAVSGNGLLSNEDKEAVAAYRGLTKAKVGTNDHRPALTVAASRAIGDASPVA